MINERHELNQTHKDHFECDHNWTLEKCADGVHYFYCEICDEENTDDCDCELTPSPYFNETFQAYMI